MIPVKNIDPDDLALYAMQLLPADEMEAMTQHLQHSEESRRTLAELYGDFALYAQSTEMHSPPALARQRLMKHVAREKKAVPVASVNGVQLHPAQEPVITDPLRPVTAPGLSLVPPAPKKSVAAVVLPWLGWALAAGMAAEIVNLYQEREHLRTTATLTHTQLTDAQVSAQLANTLMETVKDPTAVHVVLTSTGIKPPPEGRASYNAEKGSLIFLASNLEPLQTYKTYELWIIPTTGAPIPAGTFHPDNKGNASVVMPQLPKGVMAKMFGVTIEDGEGSAQPTMPIVLKGTAS